MLDDVAWDDLEAAGWTAETVRANGIDQGVYRRGEGPPVVAAHGFGLSGLRWVPVGEALADDYELIAYDARGHGRSDAPEEGWGLDARVADLRELVRTLDLEAPVLLGHSMGAATVAWTAARHPDRPRGVVLEDPVGVHEHAPGGREDRVPEVREQVRAMRNGSLAALREEYPDPESDHARRLAVSANHCHPRTAEIVGAGYPAPHAETFSRIEVPTLLLRSDRDVDDRVRDLAAAADLRDGRVVHLPGTDYYLFEEAREAALAELRTFLRRLDEGEDG